jgi:hypothetical protein
MGSPAASAEVHWSRAAGACPVASSRGQVPNHAHSVVNGEPVDRPPAMFAWYSS